MHRDMKNGVVSVAEETGYRLYQWMNYKSYSKNSKRRHEDLIDETRCFAMSRYSLIYGVGMRQRGVQRTN